MTAEGTTDHDLLRRVEQLQERVEVEANSRYLFQRYYRWVRGFFLRRGYAIGEAEDLAQETFLKVFAEIASFRHDGSFESWLFAVAANVHRNELRHWGRQKRDAPEVSLDAPVAPGEAPARQLPAPEAGADRQVYEEQRRQVLAQAIDGLPSQMRQCVTLLLDQELKYREIATLLGISTQTVKSHLFQARQRLREELGEELSGWEE